jgi:uncharacterized protein (DUF983 family)
LRYRFGAVHQTESDKQMSVRPTLRVALLRGLHLKCPNCGQGKLFRAYLKPVNVCNACHEPLGHIRADDGPAWLTILVSGHVIGPGLVLTQMRGLLSVWQGFAFWMTATIIMVLALLPYSKGVFIALLWQTRGPGSELEAQPPAQDASKT